ncbi:MULTISPECIES: O-antigen ligase family protein [unclassified Candidatus Frackibacter]|uniref:O-antigen ligase family protein n=1 Tax=unclassified Candidatus Frackibacter TaxID=2648818 RepID=UPI0007935179|nr:MULTISPECIES: O-antigen ligase family protein [unclassified Candidatus Frackibacter]KXS41565.1 MAG: O-antigen polymerase [Candidatus Frackibacter sp. T328-2]SDC46928.1 O-Antigen ligase [Candidatus Frackibacter sp. WG11]SEM81655.1 O-Antigen ligase [Candidatus Frackibacter sp. WG12]SFL72357.1 O-Antigen ligase [Candidatus Frackibacter sp. WG13]
MKEINKYQNYLYLAPIAFIISIIPLIVYLKKVRLQYFLLRYWTGTKFNWDYFSYYKMVWFLIVTAVAIILFIVYLRKSNKLKKTYYYLPLGIYAFFIIISTFLSEYKVIAFFGFPDRYEGMFVLLSYLVITFITINLVNTKQDIKFLVGSLLMSAFILGILGIFQYFGLDFFKTLTGQLLIMPDTLHTAAGTIDTKFPPNTIYATLYNPNYVGSYMVILFSFTLGLYILIKNKKYKLMVGIFNILIFANWLGSRSRAGIVGGFFAILLLIILLYQRIVKDYKYVLGIICCFIVVFSIMNYAANGDLGSELLSLGKETRMVFGEGKVSNLKDIEMNDNRLSIITETETLNVVLKENNYLKFYNQLNEEIFYSSSRYPDPYEEGEYVNVIKLHDRQYKNYHFTYVPRKDLLHFEYDKLFGNKRMKVNFKLTEKGLRIMGIKRNLYKLKEIEHWGFKNKERLGSGRGFIWSRSLPILKDTFITGYGPDTFALYFPQNDFIGKLKTFGNVLQIVDKPHNLYLQIAINTGLVSLLAVLSLFIFYFISSIKLYWQIELNDTYTIVGFGVLVAFTGYITTGFFNDSVISVAPIFWVLLGLGISINLKIKEVYSEELNK